MEMIITSESRWWFEKTVVICVNCVMILQVAYSKIMSVDGEAAATNL